MTQLHRAEVTAVRERAITGWLGSRARVASAQRRHGRALVRAEVEDYSTDRLCDGSCEWCSPTPSPGEADYLRAFPSAPARTA